MSDPGTWFSLHFLFEFEPCALIHVVNTSIYTALKTTTCTPEASTQWVRHKIGRFNSLFGPP
jgi:hypothetical protein